MLRVRGTQVAEYDGSALDAMRRWLKLRQLVQLALLRKTVSASATYPAAR